MLLGEQVFLDAKVACGVDMSLASPMLMMRDQPCALSSFVMEESAYCEVGRCVLWGSHWGAQGIGGRNSTP